MNKVGKIDPACCPPRSQRIPHKPGKVVVQMVVYLSSPLTQKPVLAGFLKGGSEDTLSVSELKTGFPEDGPAADQSGNEPKVRRMSLSSSSRCKGSVGELKNSGNRCS